MINADIKKLKHMNDFYVAALCAIRAAGAAIACGQYTAPV